jgi:hypothetical protein
MTTNNDKPPTTTVQVDRGLLNEAVKKYNARELKSKFQRPYAQREVVHIALAMLIDEMSG